MPGRIVREGILTSERVDALSWQAEVLYRRLMSVVDDYGRFYGRPALIRAACFPLRLDHVSDSDIGKWLRETEKTGLVRAYQVEGKGFLELLDFRQNVRAKESRFPAPGTSPDATHMSYTRNAEATQMSDTCNASAPVVVVVDVVEGVGDAPRKRGRVRTKTEMPENFAISDRVKAWAEDKGYDGLAEYLEAFVMKVRAGGYRYIDWDDAFMNSIREDWGKVRQRKVPHVANQNWQ